MYRTMLKAKIHRAVITGADLDYEGSLGIDQDLLDAADILPGEQVHVFNITNGNRLVTYAISRPRGSGDMLLNGAAAHRGKAGDLVIVASFAAVPETEARAHTPRILLMDGQNRVRSG